MTGCPHPFGHTDAAKRLSDAACLHWAAAEWDSVGKFIAFSLDDGSTDGNLYDTRTNAVTHQANEYNCGYIHLHPGGMTQCEAEIMLKAARQLAKAFPASKSDPARQPILRISRENLVRQMRALNMRGLPL
jgi:hypothetical protein